MEALSAGVHMSLDDTQWQHTADQVLKAAQARDRLIVAGAAGTLLLSVTFVHDIAPAPAHWTLILLVVSWGVLLVALFAAFVSMYTTEQALRCRLKEEERAEKRWNKWTRCCNYAAIGSLVVGVGMVAVFAAYNLLRGGG